MSELIVKYHAGSAYDIARVYAFRKQSDEAFKWLDQAYAQRDSGLIGTNVDPLLKNLHNDLRFAAFLKKSTCRIDVPHRRELVLRREEVMYLNVSHERVISRPKAGRRNAGIRHREASIVGR